MILDITKVQLNPIPLPIEELQKQNVILKEKNKVFKNVILGVIATGTLLILYNFIKDAKARNKKQN